MITLLVTSSTLILLLWLLRIIMKGKISFRLQYALWLLVVFRLLLPCIWLFDLHPVIENKASVMNIADTVSRHFIEKNVTTMLSRLSGQQNDTENTASIVSNDPKKSEKTVTSTTQTKSRSNPAIILKTVWLTGAVVLMIWILVVNFLFSIRLHQDREKYHTEGYPLPVYLTKQQNTPCLYGFLHKQAVYITPELVNDELQLKHILTHELYHYKHMDYIWAMVRALLLSIYWFHPLVWIAALLSKRDCELACDEAAIQSLGENQRWDYGRTLISLVSRQSGPADLIYTATSMKTSAYGIKERISMLTKKPKKLLLATSLTIILALVIITVTFTAAQNSKGTTPSVQTKTTKNTATEEQTEKEILSGKIKQLNTEDSLDLDLDGQPETIEFTVEQDPDNSAVSNYTLSVNGNIIQDSGTRMPGGLYAASLDGKTIQLLLPEDGASADYSMYVYGYEDSKLYYAGTLPGSPDNISLHDGYVTVPIEIYHLQCYSVFSDYELKKHQLAEIPGDFYEQGNTVTVLKDITLYKEKDKSKKGITLKKGSEVTILGSDLKEWVCIKDNSTGETGWLFVIEAHCSTFNKIEAEASELFDGLYYYGECVK